MCAKYFQPLEVLYNSLQTQGTEKERGLDGKCIESFEEHHWLVLPQMESQKHYLICLNCLEHSHL